MSKAGKVVVQTCIGKDGGKRVDIRLFITGAKYNGPTKKGISLPIDKLPELLRLLESAG